MILSRFYRYKVENRKLSMSFVFERALPKNYVFLYNSSHLRKTFSPDFHDFDRMHHQIDKPVLCEYNKCIYINDFRCSLVV